MKRLLLIPFLAATLLHAADFTVSTTIDNLMTAADQSAARTAIGAVSQSEIDTSISAIDSINLEYSASTSAGEPLENDDSYSGPVLVGLNGGETIAQWETVYFDGTANEWLLADSDGSGTYPASGFATAATSDGAAASIIRKGFIRNDAWAWTPGQLLYLSTTAGGITATAPSTSGDAVQIIGQAITADIIYVDVTWHYSTVN